MELSWARYCAQTGKSKCFLFSQRPPQILKEKYQEAMNRQMKQQLETELSKQGHDE